jgi:hypothetical protein
MTIDELLWDNERKFWTEATAFHQHHMADECLLLLPPPAGVLTKEGFGVWLNENPPWAGIRFGGRRLLALHERVLMLAYNATAHRRNDPVTYRALASSVYRNRDGEWKLAFHQQTLDELFSGATGRFERLREP